MTTTWRTVSISCNNFTKSATKGSSKGTLSQRAGGRWKSGGRRAPNSSWSGPPELEEGAAAGPVIGCRAVPRLGLPRGDSPASGASLKPDLRKRRVVPREFPARPFRGWAFLLGNFTGVYKSDLIPFRHENNACCFTPIPSAALRASSNLPPSRGKGLVLSLL